MRKLVLLLLYVPMRLYASFIESTLGAAVVKDATASFYNPAALTSLSNLQGIALGSVAVSNTHFNGQALQKVSNLREFGQATSKTNYYLPSFYFGAPYNEKFSLGLAIIADMFNGNIEDHSILRYSQANSTISDLDIVPAIGIKLNSYFSLGFAVDFSRAHFILRPISGIPSLNIPDAQSHNESHGSAIGGDVGILFQPNANTVFGFNYRSAIQYALKGTSRLESLLSNDYSFTYWAPARAMLSANHFVNKKLGFIGTVQYIQWNVFDEIHSRGIATPSGIKEVVTPYHFHNTWLITLGNHYRLSEKLVLRLAANYNQKPAKGNFQISTGDGFILGGSIGYNLSKHITIDASYAHGFIRNQNINIDSMTLQISGINKAFRDSVSLKLTLNQ